MSEEEGRPVQNLEYNKKLLAYYACVTLYLNEMQQPQILEKQLARTDLETVCAYELYQMKKSFCDGPTLNLSQFKPM